jgi:ABC-type hemin transport system substrate-binding protein
MTTTLQQVGLGDHLVGRSAFCRNVEQLPVAGDLERTNVECLVRLNPTHVFAQGRTDGRHADLRALSTQHKFDLCAHPLRTVEEVQDFLARVAINFPEVANRSAELADRLEAAMTPQHPHERPTVLIMSEGSSLLAWGSETYLGQLVRAIGFDNMAPSRKWQALTLEDVARINPDCILVPANSSDPDLSTLSAVVPSHRLKVLALPGIDLPGPHLAEIHPYLVTLRARLGNATGAAP